MSARMKKPVEVLPDALKPLQAVYRAVANAGIPPHTLHLVHLRVSQINGCGFCIDGGVKQAKKAGETDERLFAISAWRETPYFSDAERAALALAEAATRLSDREDPVPDAVWNEAARHYDEKGLAALVLYVGLTNFWNRLNVSTRQPAGQGW